MRGCFALLTSLNIFVTLLAVVVGAFCTLGLEMDLVYTQDWYHGMESPHREAASAYIHGTMGWTVWPLVATNLVWLLLCALAVRRWESATSPPRRPDLTPFDR